MVFEKALRKKLDQGFDPQFDLAENPSFLEAEELADLQEACEADLFEANSALDLSLPFVENQAEVDFAKMGAGDFADFEDKVQSSFLGKVGGDEFAADLSLDSTFANGFCAEGKTFDVDGDVDGHFGLAAANLGQEENGGLKPDLLGNLPVLGDDFGLEIKPDAAIASLELKVEKLAAALDKFQPQSAEKQNPLEVCCGFSYEELVAAVSKEVYQELRKELQEGLAGGCSILY